MPRVMGMVLFVILGLLLNNLEAHAVTFPALVGHRGVGDPAVQRLGIPENSLPAWAYAASHGAEFIDMDVQLTSDGKMVIMHDLTLNRTTNRTGYVRDRSLAYIKDSFLELPGVDKDGNNNDDNTKWHPPSLAQALAAVKPTGLWLTVELKGHGWTKTQVGRYLDVLRNYSVQGRTITHTFNETVLGYVKSLAPSYPRGSVISAAPLPSVSTVKSRGGYVFIRLSLASQSYVASLRTAGVKSFVWTLDEPLEYDKALATGAYGWVCDEIDEAKTWLEANGA